jgi:hypothetical protein
MVWTWVIALMLGLGGWIHEYPRYKKCKMECLSQYHQDYELINRDVCANLQDRILFTKTVDCQGAETRLKQDPAHCARMKWWQESHVAQIFGSYWSILPIILMIIYMTCGNGGKKSHKKKRKDNVKYLTQ